MHKVLAYKRDHIYMEEVYYTMDLNGDYRST